MIHFPIAINGIEEFYFELDTCGGVGYATINPKGLKKLYGQQSNKNVTLRMGDFVLKNTPLRAWDIGDSGFKGDGLINNRILDKFKTRIDFSKMQLSFEINE
ncbi:hypothetical protein ACFL6P_01020 [Candidatus Latescibacterota bacterium]